MILFHIIKKIFRWSFSGSIASRYKVSKYPTLKLIRNGIPLKKEYRGQRSPEAFLEYIKKQLESPVIEFKDLKEVLEIDVCTGYRFDVLPVRQIVA